MENLYPKKKRKLVRKKCQSSSNKIAEEFAFIYRYQNSSISMEIREEILKTDFSQ